jgi:hypothetical protein
MPRRWLQALIAATPSLRVRPIEVISIGLGPSSLRLAAQDVALSRRKQGFESPRERQSITHHFDFPFDFGIFPNLLRAVWAALFLFRPSNFVIAAPAKRS